MPLYIAQSGDLDRCYRCLTDWLTHWLTTLKDRATQLLIKYKSGALVTQKVFIYMSSFQGRGQFKFWRFRHVTVITTVHILYLLLFQILFVKVKRTSERLLIMQKFRSQRVTLERHVSLFCAIATTEAFSTRQCEVAEQSRVEMRIAAMSIQD